VGLQGLLLNFEYDKEGQLSAVIWLYTADNAKISCQEPVKEDRRASARSPIFFWLIT
jgi:hypothetical protein